MTTCGPAKLRLLLMLSLLLLDLTGCRRRPAVDPPIDAGGGVNPVRVIYPSAPGSFVKLVGKASKSLVHIRTNVPVRDGPADWFPSAVLPGATSEEWVTRLQRALGSGFIVDRQGFIVTNAHIVGEKRPIWVELHDKTALKAELIGSDLKTDVALLKVQAPPNVTLRPLRFGKAAQLQVGEWVVALGNPFGLGHRVNAGIVSAPPRIDPASAQFGRLSHLQLDIAVNAGNSGGPLLNSIGEVIGLCAATESAVAGVGFALPIELVAQLISSLKRHGKLERAWVGWQIIAVPKPSRAKLPKGQSGGLITMVYPHGPAARAGIRGGDILLSFNKQPVRDINRLPWIASAAGIGQPIPVVVLRDGKRHTFDLRTAPMTQ